MSGPPCLMPQELLNSSVQKKIIFDLNFLMFLEIIRIHEIKISPELNFEGFERMNDQLRRLD